jgi:hypothetical protein
MEPNSYPKTNRRWEISIVSIVALFAVIVPAAHGVIINYGSSIDPSVKHYLSDSTEIQVAGDGSSGFFFQVGTFIDNFVPTTDNTDSWLAHWTPVTTAAGDELPEATTEFTTFETDFGPVNAFTRSLTLVHNDAPFLAGAQGYVWGYNTRDTPGTAEWILLTNTDPTNTDPTAKWIFPPEGSTSPAPAWTVGNANPLESEIVGSIDGDSMTLGQVTIPGPVPEPSTFVLTTVAIAVLATARRRRPTKIFK